MRPPDRGSRFDDLRATLVSPPFVIALFALLANDFWFKRAWPGFVTGKLSDFAGIAVVTLLALALSRSRRWIPYTCIVLGFTWWKSPLSQAFIETVNVLTPWPIARVVDFTDLMALSIMPLCGQVSSKARQLAGFHGSLRRWVLPPITVLTSFALMATSMPTAQEYFRVRQQQPDVALDPKAIFASVAEVTEWHGLECQDCGSPLTGAVFTGRGIELRYAFEAPDTLRFRVHAGPSGFPFGRSGMERSDRLVGDLKRRLSLTHRGLVLTQELDPDKSRQW